jgi:hypothetical protein
MTQNPITLTFQAAVDPIQIDLSLDSILTSLEQEANLAVQTPLDPPLDPQVIQHVQTMGTLASQLQAEVAEINRLDPNALTRLKARQGSGSQSPLT